MANPIFGMDFGPEEMKAFAESLVGVNNMRLTGSGLAYVDYSERESPSTETRANPKDFFSWAGAEPRRWTPHMISLCPKCQAVNDGYAGRCEACGAEMDNR